MTISEAIVRVQEAYPRIYLACHSRHQNSRTSAPKVSQRDSSILSHLNETTPVAQSDLARHLGVVKSTLSAALASLEKRGLIERRVQTRTAEIRRTASGTAAMSGSSVLEAARLRAVLEALNGDDLVRAVEGMELIARAANGRRHAV
jgi:DNA-binding MarR family transcriptional regulator